MVVPTLEPGSQGFVDLGITTDRPPSSPSPPPISSEYRLQDLVVPTLEPGSQGFVDLGFTTDGALLPETSRVWQFSFTPIKAENVGPTGEGGGGGRGGAAARDGDTGLRGGGRTSRMW